MAEKKSLSAIVVEDDPELREAMAAQFLAAGCVVRQASGVKAALESFKAEPADLVLADVKMREGGLELLDALRKNDADRPKVYFMMSPGDVTAEVAFDRGASGMFPKPFNVSTLLAILKSIGPGTLKWAVLPSQLESSLTISREFKSLQDASDLKEFRIGRGGFSIKLHGEKAHPLEVVSFLIRFTAEAELHELEGIGSVRWASDDSCGVEFLGFANPTLRTKVLQLTKSLSTHSTIPKLH